MHIAWGQALEAACFGPKSKDPEPLNRPTPLVTRTRWPRVPLAGGHRLLHSAPLRCQRGRVRSRKALAVFGLRAWGAAGRGSAVPPVTARPLNPAWLENRCVPARSAPGPGGAQSLAFPLLARSSARELTPLSPGYCRPGGIRSGNARLVFSRRSFCLYPLRSFSLCEKSRGVQSPSPLGSSQSFLLLTPCTPPLSPPPTPAPNCLF